MARTGRPSKRTPAVERAILDGLAKGVSLPKILTGEGMPNIRTVHDWMEADEVFRTGVARARAIGTEHLVTSAGDLIDNCDGSSSSEVQKAVSQANWRKWLASCYARGVYGERKGVEVSGPDGGPVNVESLVSLVKLAASSDKSNAPVDEQSK